MALYNKVTLPKVNIENSDFKVEVWDSKGKIGTLVIKKATVEWASYKKWKGNRRMRWRKFDKLMAENE
ncbi:MAG: hypothetical protein IPN36_02745 [Bacteroidetes bacterium]|nr:hypothetical protein [Bacteroidota bacterium]